MKNIMSTRVFRVVVVGIAAACCGCIVGSRTYQGGGGYTSRYREPSNELNAPDATTGQSKIMTLDDFAQNLEGQGSWQSDGPEGQKCWTPNKVSDDWRPYTQGQWVETGDGLAFQSEEPWADTTYHYGRWYQRPSGRWYWMPGYEWGPAWVMWRSGGGFIGWAPLPPGPIGVMAYRIPHSAYTFVASDRIATRGIARHAVPVYQNTTIINKTAVITKVTNTTVNNTLVVNQLKRDSGQTFDRRETRVAHTAHEAQAIRSMGGVPVMVAKTPAPAVPDRPSKPAQRPTSFSPGTSGSVARGNTAHVNTRVKPPMDSASARGNSGGIAVPAGGKFTPIPTAQPKLQSGNSTPPSGGRNSGTVSPPPPVRTSTTPKPAPTPPTSTPKPPKK